MKRGLDDILTEQPGATLDEITTDPEPIQLLRLEQTAINSFIAHVPMAKGCAVMTLGELYGPGPEAVVSIDVPGGSLSDEPVMQRINLTSASARETLERQLRGIYGFPDGDKFFWPRALNNVFSKVRKAFTSQDLSVAASDLPETHTQEFLADTILPMGEPTVFFGAGEAGKSYLGYGLAVAVAGGKRLFAGLHLQQSNVLVIDYETQAANFRYRVGRLAEGLRCPLDRLRRYPAIDTGLPLWDLVTPIKQLIRDHNVAFVVIDSAGPACAGQPESAEMTTRYFLALNSLGITSLTIAHVKGGDLEVKAPIKPFGSVFWLNLARRTWLVKGTNCEGDTEKHVGLVCKKANDGPRPEALAFRFNFGPQGGPVTVALADFSAVPELDRARALQYRIREALSLNQMTTEQVAELLNEETDSVGARLREHPDMFERVGGGPGRGNKGVWQNRRKTDGKPTKTDEEG